MPAGLAPVLYLPAMTEIAKMQTPPDTPFAGGWLRSAGEAMSHPAVLRMGRALLLALALVAATTVCLLAVTRVVELKHISSAYLIPVLIAAIKLGVVPAIVAATGGVGASAFFFYPPIYDFRVSDPQQLLDLPLFIVVATVTGQLAARALLAVCYRALTFVKLKESVFLTARTSAMVCWLFIGSAIFSAIFAYLGGQAYVEQFVLGLGLNSVGFMIMAQAIIFLLGWPLEWTEIIIIFVPIFLPLLDDFGIDPLFFGVMVALNLQTSFLSPPVAMAPFYLKGVAPKEVSINEIFSGVMPYIFIVVGFMVLMYLFPGMALWLPKYMYG